MYLGSSQTIGQALYGAFGSALRGRWGETEAVPASAILAYGATSVAPSGLLSSRDLLRPIVRVSLLIDDSERASCSAFGLPYGVFFNS
jgi:hypothetical protein